MAKWKKLLVSGSNISQLTNDAGYLTSETAQVAYTTASVGGVHLIANDQYGQLTFATASSEINISGSAGNDTLTFSLAGGVISGSGQVDINSTTGTLTTLGTVTSGNINAILPSGLVSASAQIDHDSTTNFVAGEHFLQSAITTVGTVTTGDIDALLPTGTVSGSISVPSQGSISINGITHDLQLQTGDSPSFNGLTVTNNLAVGGNLTVSGTTTQLNVTNLDIEDKFILLNSGSSSVGDESGIIFGGSGGQAHSGSAIFWNGDFNGNDGRLAVGHNFGASQGNGASPAYYVGGVFSGSLEDASGSLADHYGNIRIEAGEIFIYV